MFQSHAGSIEARQSWSGCDSSWSGFNPTLVRLRLVRFEIPEIGELMFQSHAGSIEATKCVGLLTNSRLFQSHAGSIEAGWSAN